MYIYIYILNSKHLDFIFECNGYPTGVGHRPLQGIYLPVRVIGKLRIYGVTPFLRRCVLGNH